MHMFLRALEDLCRGRQEVSSFLLSLAWPLQPLKTVRAITSVVHRKDTPGTAPGASIAPDRSPTDGRMAAGAAAEGGSTSGGPTEGVGVGNEEAPQGAAPVSGGRTDGAEKASAAYTEGPGVARGTQAGGPESACGQYTEEPGNGLARGLQQGRGEERGKAEEAMEKKAKTAPVATTRQHTVHKGASAAMRRRHLLLSAPNQRLPPGSTRTGTGTGSERGVGRGSNSASLQVPPAPPATPLSEVKALLGDLFEGLTREAVEQWKMATRHKEHVIGCASDPTFLEVRLPPRLATSDL